MAVKIQLRRGTEAQFNSASLDPLDGEVFLVQVNDSNDTGGYLVVGDGTRTWEQLRDDVDARVYFEPGYSQTVMGGEQPAGNTPLTVKGATSQTAAILKVTNKGDNSILEIYDDEGPTVRLEDHGDVGEVFAQLKQQENQTANALELHDHGDNDQLTISCDGEVAITPTNNQNANAPSLDVKGSAATQSNGILRVQANNGNKVLQVSNDEAILGSVPDHAIPAIYGKIRSATNPGNTDSGAGTEFEDSPHFLLQSQGGATNNQRGQLSLVGNQGVTTSEKSIQVKKNGVSTARLEADYDGNLFLENKATLGDAEIYVTSRSLADASILRADEIFARLEKQVSPFSFSITGTLNNNDTNSGLRLLRLEGAEDDDARKRQTFDPVNVGSAFQLKNVQGTGSSPETFPSDANDTNPYLIYVPANSGPFTIYFCVYTNTGQTNDNMEIYSYTSTDAVTGKATVGTMSVAGGADTNNFDFRRSQLLAHVANSSTDLYYGFAYGLSNTSGSDSISTDGTATLSIGELAHEGERGMSNAAGNVASERLPMVTFFRGHLGMGAYTRIQPS